MTRIPEPPIYQEIAAKEDGKATLPWILFFNSLYNGDTGTAWTPTFQNLTEVGGTSTKVGRYYKIGQGLCFFRVTVTPVTNTSATAGTTYIDNFPLLFTSDSANLAVSGVLGSNAGMNVASNNRIYPPTWTTLTNPVTIIGFGEVR